MTQPVANIANTVGTAGASTAPFVTYFSTVNPTPQNTQFPVQKRWVNTLTSEEFVLSGFNSAGGIVTANWLNISSGSLGVETLTGNSGGAVGPASGNINVKGDATTINIIGVPSSNTLTANVILPVTAHSVLVGETSSIAGITPGSSGTVLTSNGASADPSFQTVPVSLLPYSAQSTSFNITPNSGYIVTTGGITATLASVASTGDQVTLINLNAGALTVKAPAGQSIQIGNSVSTVGGQATSTGTGNTLSLIYYSPSTLWISTGTPEGAWVTS